MFSCSVCGQVLRSLILLTLLSLLAASGPVSAQPTRLEAAARSSGKPALEFPAELPGGKAYVRHRSAEFLEPAGTLRNDVTVAGTVPTVEFLYYPGHSIVRARSIRGARGPSGVTASLSPASTTHPSATTAARGATRSSMSISR